MISVSDNFLSSPELEYHRNILLSKVNTDTLQSIGMWMNSYEMESGDSKDIHKKLGIVWKTTCEKIQTYFLDTLNIEVEPYSIRYQCMTDRYVIHPHLDGSVREKSLDASYTSILYLNDTWDESLGGNFEIDNISLASLPNRLIIYSRDELHSVSKPTKEWKIPRMLLLVSWNKI